MPPKHTNKKVGRQADRRLANKKEALDPLRSPLTKNQRAEYARIAAANTKEGQTRINREYQAKKAVAPRPPTAAPETKYARQARQSVDHSKGKLDPAALFAGAFSAAARTRGGGGLLGAVRDVVVDARGAKTAGHTVEFELPNDHPILHAAARLPTLTSRVVLPSDKAAMTAPLVKDAKGPEIAPVSVNTKTVTSEARITGLMRTVPGLEGGRRGRSGGIGPTAGGTIQYGIRVRHRELLGPLNNPSTNGGFSNNIQYANPSNSAFTPWCARLATNFDQFYYRYVVPVYVSGVTSSVNGIVGFMTDYQATDNAAPTEAIFDDTTKAVTGKLWANLRGKYVPKGPQQQRYFIANPSDGTAPDPLLVYPCTIQIMTSGTDNPGGNVPAVYGRVWIEYDVEMWQQTAVSNGLLAATPSLIGTDNKSGGGATLAATQPYQAVGSNGAVTTTASTFATNVAGPVPIVVSSTTAASLYMTFPFTYNAPSQLWSCGNSSYFITLVINNNSAKTSALSLAVGATSTNASLHGTLFGPSTGTIMPLTAARPLLATTPYAILTFRVDFTATSALPTAPFVRVDLGSPTVSFATDTYGGWWFSATPVASATLGKYARVSPTDDPAISRLVVTETSDALGGGTVKRTESLVSSNDVTRALGPEVDRTCGPPPPAPSLPTPSSAPDSKGDYVCGVCEATFSDAIARPTVMLVGVTEDTVCPNCAAALRAGAGKAVERRSARSASASTVRR